MLSTRRQILRGVTLAAPAFALPGFFAEALAQTAVTGDGPFYPDRLPLDTDNDLLIINAGITPAVGRSHASDGTSGGTASPYATPSSRSGKPIRTARISIPEAATRARSIRIFRATAVFSPTRRAAITSGRSSRCRTRCSVSFAPRTSILR